MESTPPPLLVDVRDNKDVETKNTTTHVYQNWCLAKFMDAIGKEISVLSS